jgi:hypothetical protein
MHGEVDADGDRGDEAEREHGKLAPSSLSPSRLFDERLRVDEELVGGQRFGSARSLFDDRHR